MAKSVTKRASKAAATTKKSSKAAATKSTSKQTEMKKASVSPKKAAKKSATTTQQKSTGTAKAKATTKKVDIKKASPTAKKADNKTTTKKATLKKATAKKTVKSILISQPKPSSEKSPYFDLAKKYGLNLHFHQFIKVEGIGAKEFRKQNIDLAEYGSVVMLSRNSVDHFFRICEEIKFKVSPDMRYFCATEQVALYLQKFILYRKRKVFFSADGSPEGLMDVLAKFKDKGKFLMPVSEFTRNEISPILRKNKVKFSETVMYRTVSNELTGIDAKKYDLVILFSPFGVDAIMADLGDIKKRQIPVGTFGTSTTEAAEKAGLNLQIKAPTPVAPSMVTAIENYIKSLESGS